MIRLNEPISDTEMHRRLDDLATNPARLLTPMHYRKTIEALANLLDAKERYDEKPGFWRQQKVDWHLANVKPGLAFGPVPNPQQFYDILKMQAKAFSAAR